MIEVRTGFTTSRVVPRERSKVIGTVREQRNPDRPITEVRQRSGYLK